MDRAGFIRLTATIGAGFGLAFTLPGSASAAAGDAPHAFAPNAWVRIAPDETITIVLNKSEMGQGVATGLPTILADELDASLGHVRTEFAPADARYNDVAFKSMVTGGSTSIADSWLPLRQAGATARAMLVAAAAKRWNVDASACSTHAGVVHHLASKRSATYGSLASAAALESVPEHVALKPAAAFTLIGKRHQRLDIPHKVNGSATYGIDVRIPGMVYAAIARSPVYGGHVKRFDARKARAVPGVLHVVQISNGVAVVAKNTYAAFQGKLALDIAWDEGANAHVSTESLFAEAQRLSTGHVGEHVVISRGDPESRAGTVLEATYRGPMLAHATMEPQNTTADVRDGRCEVWSPTQVQTKALAVAAAASGLPPEKCTIHTTFLGGGFGRRLEADYVGEAVEVSKAVQLPVKVMWSREDDTQHDFYRPMSLNAVRGVVADGALTTLTHQVVQASWLRRWAPPLVTNGVDPLALLEVDDVPYAIPNVRTSYIDHEHGMPVGSWRAPNANWNGFVTESFLDELAHAAGKDPLTFRLSLLGKNPRAAHVLELAAQRGDWGRKRAGFGQGLALTSWAGSYGAMVVEVSMAGNKPKVHRVVAVVDCGTVINPDIVVQQAQGATNFGLSAALTGKITIKNGRVEQANFYDYTVLRMADAPPIEVHVVPSTAPPTGIGEICTPPIAPAVGNAIFALTGKRIRTLPFLDALA
jgi:isoquinoline 1-oxidoreductase beta subunit